MLKVKLIKVAVQEGGNVPMELEMSRSSTIRDIKRKMCENGNYVYDELRIFFRGKEVDDDWHMHTNMNGNECLIYTHCSRKPGDIKICGLESLANLTNTSQKILENLLQQARAGFANQVDPELSEDGSGGTYFLKNKMGTKVACFKPRDEEPSAVNNPRGIINKGLRDGVRVGEATDREVAAFITDTDGFSSVPETIMVEAAHDKFHYYDGNIRPKVGSLQKYVVADCIAADFSPHLFPVDEVHKIAILDIRLLNSDRNDANMLVIRRPKMNYAQENIDVDGQYMNRRKVRSCSLSPKDFEYELIPIDHGYCLPDRLEVTWCDWCWLDWPQTRQPFSEKTKEWINNYDIDANVDKLKRELNIREPCLRLMKISGLVLKKAVNAGLCLHDIASMIVREDMDVPSVLEEQIQRAMDLAKMMLKNARVRGDSFSSHISYEDVDTNATTNDHNLNNLNSVVTKASPRSRRATLSSVELPDFNSMTVTGDSMPYSPLIRVNSGGDILQSYVSDNGDNSIVVSPSQKENRFKSMKKKSSEPLRISIDSKFNDGTRIRSTSSNDQQQHELTHDETKNPTIFVDEFQSLKDDTTSSERFERYFFEYLERLVDDVIMCVHKHRKRDKSMFRRTSSLHLTSPHRKLHHDDFPNLRDIEQKRRPRCESMGSFFATANNNLHFSSSSSSPQEVPSSPKSETSPSHHPCSKSDNQSFVTANKSLFVVSSSVTNSKDDESKQDEKIKLCDLDDEITPPSFKPFPLSKQQKANHSKMLKPPTHPNSQQTKWKIPSAGIRRENNISRFAPSV